MTLHPASVPSPANAEGSVRVASPVLPPACLNAELQQVSPDDILQSAMERYRRSDGYEGHLVEAAAVLETLGQQALPALCELARSGNAECEYFVGTIVRLQGVSTTQKHAALLTLAQNPDPNTRSRLLEVLEELPRELRLELQRVLSNPTFPADNVTERARQALAESLRQG